MRMVDNVAAGGADTARGCAIDGVGDAVGKGFIEGTELFDGFATGSGLMTLGVGSANFGSVDGALITGGGSVVDKGDP